jgi:ATP adenylyltransferase
MSPGEPDGLERLWTPHRMAYIKGDERKDVYPFDAAPEAKGEDSLVVARGEVVYAVLNLYPYNPGHLLICPYRHVADYTELTAEETSEVGRLTQTAMTVLRSVSAPHGFNLGINQGAVAGAGIAAHLHQHVVPRWSGDANFLPVVGQTKALPQLLGQTWAIVSRAWVEAS